jgi:hypothetical protein
MDRAKAVHIKYCSEHQISPYIQAHTILRSHIGGPILKVKMIRLWGTRGGGGREGRLPSARLGPQKGAGHLDECKFWLDFAGWSIGLTKTVAREYAGRNITCNAVTPGFIK